MARRKTTMPIPNDNISNSLAEILGELPKEFKGSDKFLDVISWNLRWFNYREKERVERVAEVLTFLNADIFIFQEVEEGSLEEVVNILESKNAGLYQVVYGSTGGDQRVAFMYDTEWVRAKDSIAELFGKGAVRTGNNKDAFPRLPLYGYFLTKSANRDIGFTFQLVGVHLKSQVGGGNTQRIMAAEKLVDWLEKESIDVDSDTIIIGDWNKGPGDDDWAPIHELEEQEKIFFRSINDTSEFSHLYYENKTKFGSRLDCALMTKNARLNMPEDQTKVCRWLMIDDLLASAPEMTAAAIKETINTIKQEVTDHMPLFARYYLTEERRASRKKSTKQKSTTRKKAGTR